MTHEDLSFSFTPYVKFTYWFERKYAEHAFDIWDTALKCYIGVLCPGERIYEPEILLSEDFTNCCINKPAIIACWKSFVQTRPEYIVGDAVDISDASSTVAISSHMLLYEKYLCGAAMLAGRAIEPESDPDTWIPWKCLQWLRKTDFYEAPASTQYHDAVPGGLCRHSLLVLNNILELRKIPKFSTVPIYKATRAALVHDWCKIGYYESYLRNVKNEATGQWEKVPSFKKRELTATAFGHGVSSMFLAQQCFRLSAEEALAIRWHMGPWRVVNSEMDELQQANENYPLVHLLQFADQLSIVNY